MSLLVDIVYFRQSLMKMLARHTKPISGNILLEILQKLMQQKFQILIYFWEVSLVRLFR